MGSKVGGYGKFKNRPAYAGFGTLLRHLESIIINSYIQGQSYLKKKSTVGISQMFRTFSEHSDFLLGQSMYGILIDLRSSKRFLFINFSFSSSIRSFLNILKKNRLIGFFFNFYQTCSSSR